MSSPPQLCPATGGWIILTEHGEKHDLLFERIAVHLIFFADDEQVVSDKSKLALDVLVAPLQISMRSRKRFYRRG